MAHVRRLGLLTGILLSSWAYALRFMEIGQDELYLWLAPFVILCVTSLLAVRRTVPVDAPFTNFITGIKAALGVVVIAVVIYNIAVYILFTMKPGETSPFKEALLSSWTLLALGMLVSLVVAFLTCFRSPERKP